MFSKQELENKVFQEMIEYRDSRINAELTKTKKREDELAKTGKTKIEESNPHINTTIFYWLSNVLARKLDVADELVKEALDSLILQGKVEKDKELKGCYFIPLRDK